MVSSCENPTGFHITIIISNQVSCLDFRKGPLPSQLLLLMVTGEGREGGVFPIQRDELESLLRDWRLWTESWGVNRRIADQR